MLSAALFKKLNAVYRWTPACPCPSMSMSVSMSLSMPMSISMSVSMQTRARKAQTSERFVANEFLPFPSVFSWRRDEHRTSRSAPSPPGRLTARNLSLQAVSFIDRPFCANRSAVTTLRNGTAGVLQPFGGDLRGALRRLLRAHRPHASQRAGRRPGHPVPNGSLPAHQGAGRRGAPVFPGLFQTILYSASAQAKAYEGGHHADTPSFSRFKRGKVWRARESSAPS